ncbi:helix-turn-helix domain-containing protein [Geminicoccus roseus]|uniref:helix-turn-helix domain-containing protein n=1 Tax=Geminicoccus roseus TaxID=404900 RepID=UPI0012F87DBC|nr:AraC family transcriptional regulator [Geminicoccus roseus]
MSFDRAWLDRPNPLWALGHPILSAEPLAQDHVRSDDDRLTAALLWVIEHAALCEASSLVNAAGTLSLSLCSLQRRLAGLDMSFEALVEAWRHRQACHRFAGSDKPVGSVARALIYRHTAHFVRALHRWEGMTQRTCRRICLARHGNRASADMVDMDGRQGIGLAADRIGPLPYTSSSRR